MPNRNADTVELKLRPGSQVVRELKELAASCGFKTHNELAVALIEIGMSLARNPEGAELPDELLRLRARLHGPSAATPSPALRELVAELVRAELAKVEAAAPKSRQKPAA